MKNKIIKTLSLGIATIMISVLTSVSIPKNHTVALTYNPTHKSITIQCEDPPFHS